MYLLTHTHCAYFLCVCVRTANCFAMCQLQFGGAACFSVSHRERKESLPSRPFLPRPHATLRGPKPNKTRRAVTKLVPHHHTAPLSFPVTVLVLFFFFFFKTCEIEQLKEEAKRWNIKNVIDPSLTSAQNFLLSLYRLSKSQCARFPQNSFIATFL